MRTYGQTGVIDKSTTQTCLITLWGGDYLFIVLYTSEFEAYSYMLSTSISSVLLSLLRPCSQGIISWPCSGFVLHLIIPVSFGTSFLDARAEL